MDFIFYLFLAYCWGSFCEWFAHKNLMHKRNKNFLGVFDLHTEHHKAYPRNSFQGSSSDSMYKGLLLCLEHIMIFMLPAALVIFPFNPLMSLTFVGFGVFHFFWYNQIHKAMHLSTKPWWLPYWMLEVISFNHFLHHQYPTKAFNVTLPGADFVLGTTVKPTFSDLKEWVCNRRIYRAFSGFPKIDKQNLDRLDNCLLGPKTLKYMENGYIAPPPGPEASVIGWFILHLILKLFVGKGLSVTGNIPDVTKDTYIFACSHNSWADLFVFKSLVWDVRVAAAQSVMKFSGLGLLLGPFLGCFAVAPGKGIAVQAGIDLLKRGESVLICPEGWAYQSRETYPFQSGVVRMASGGGVQIVPVYIDYGVHRSKQFLSLWFPLQVILDAVDPFKQRGYHVIIGDPLPSDTPLDVVEYKVKKLGGYYGF